MFNTADNDEEIFVRKKDEELEQQMVGPQTQFKRKDDVDWIHLFSVYNTNYILYLKIISKFYFILIFYKMLYLIKLLTF